jgi:hypothetical protein
VAREVEGKRGAEDGDKDESRRAAEQGGEDGAEVFGRDGGGGPLGAGDEAE